MPFICSQFRSKSSVYAIIVRLLIESQLTRDHHLIFRQHISIITFKILKQVFRQCKLELFNFVWIYRVNRVTIILIRQQRRGFLNWHVDHFLKIFLQHHFMVLFRNLSSPNKFQGSHENVIVKLLVFSTGFIQHEGKQIQELSREFLQNFQGF